MMQEHRRDRAVEILRLGQLVAVGINGPPEDFSALQRKLIDEIENE